MATQTQSKPQSPKANLNTIEHGNENDIGSPVLTAENQAEIKQDWTNFLAPSSGDISFTYAPGVKDSLIESPDEKAAKLAEIEALINSFEGQTETEEKEIEDKAETKVGFPSSGSIKFRETTVIEETISIQPENKTEEKTKLVDFGLLASESINFVEKGVKNATKLWKESGLGELIWVNILGKGGGKPKEKQEKDPKKAAEQAKKKAQNAEKNRFNRMLASLLAPFANLEGIRAKKSKVKETNQQRKAANISDETIMDQSGQLHKYVEADIQRMSAEDRKRQERQKAMSMASGKGKAKTGPGLPTGKKGAKVESTNLEMVGGNSRIRGANASG